ncbi:hypothetical protein F5Y03DRAFT_251008 [Xylaria venustula]|nr:hypothetical protein F5Y03DRAFT_251008 [Xylaria venustula]
MPDPSENTKPQKGQQTRQSSPKSASSLSPKADEFTPARPAEAVEHPEHQFHRYRQGNDPQRPQQQANIAPPPGFRRGGRGKVWNQSNLQPMRHGQPYQYPPMIPMMPGMPMYPAFFPIYPPPYGGQEMFQPMYPMPQPMNIPTPSQPALSQGRRHGQGIPNVGPSKNSSSPQPVKTNGNTRTSIRENPPSRSVSGSSHSQPSPRTEPKKDKMSQYREDFEAARSFEDDTVYFPNGNPKNTK